MNNTKEIADLIQKVNTIIKRKFRLLERTKIKIIKKEWSIKYNEKYSLLNIQKNIINCIL